MSKAIQLSIKEPCHENWQNMTPNEQGRHCMSCQKTVVDFTAMSDKEVLTFFTKTSSNICGRFNNHQLERDIKEQAKKKKYTFAYAWSVLVATTLVTTNAKAQGNVSLKGKIKVEKLNKVELRPAVMGMIAYEVLDIPVTGFVFDSETMQPVIGASVKIKETGKGNATLEDGSFVFNNVAVAKGVQLEISAIGYETQTYPLSRSSITKDLKIYLRQKVELLDPVVVIGYETVGKVDIVNASMPAKVDTSSDDNYIIIVGGAVSVCHKQTVKQKVKNVISDWIPAPFKNNSVKVFPNPQRPGSTLNISLQLKETGDYKMELMDASGRVVWIQPLQIVSKEQIVTLPTNAAWSIGVYYVRITGRNIKNVYQSKVLLK